MRARSSSKKMIARITRQVFHTFFDNAEKWELTRRDWIHHRILHGYTSIGTRVTHIIWTQFTGNENSAATSADSQRASVWLPDTLSVRVRLYKSGRVETRDAGRRRGPRHHPRPLRAKLSQNPPALPLRLPLVRTLAPSSPPTTLTHEGAIRRFTPAMLPTNTVRSYSSSSRFLRFFAPLAESCPSSIAFFYHILYFLCRPCTLHALRSFIAYLSSRAVDPA